MDKPRSPEVEAFWKSFRGARGVTQQDYDVCRFGSSPEMGDELLALVLKGPQTRHGLPAARRRAGR